ncbi:TolC family protein [Brachyspira murdochii]|uniref:Outer membrane efflux protein n=1 Tax=Brachyspira murdochii (strain ATCC 51284 / DSM 12563 / 56-150) TaxID=526224 RepID=D5UAE5_BRAM5|nr:TolC family protein [Brachyspira murdochii]ADG71668.1 outer membrane efflux protein [Brachyspira murdochii DSM 12563]
MRFYATLFLSLIFSFALYSQEADTNTINTADKIAITLEDALTIAFDNDKTLKQAEYNVRIAQVQKDASFSDLFMPSLSISGGLNLSESQEYNVNNVPTGVYSSPDTWSASASLSKTLFNGFRNWNTDKARDVNLQMQKDIYYDEKKNVDLNTKLNFYNTFVAQENYRVYLQQQMNYSNRMRETYVKYRNGQVSEYEYLNAKVQYETTKPQVVTLSNQYQSLKLTFIRQIGLTNAADDVDLIGSILDATNITLPDMAYDDLLTIIMNNNIELKNMSSNLEMLEYNRRVARSYLWPTLSASANVGVTTVDKVKMENGTFTKNRGGEFNWGVGFSLNYALDSLLPFSSTAKGAEEIELSIKQMEVSYEQLRDTIEVSSRDLISTARSQALNLQSQAENARTAAYALQMAQRQYRGGTISMLEVNDAEVVYLNAQLAYLQAIYEYFSSTLQVLKLLGA